MGAYISMSSEIGGRALIGAWALKGTNMVCRMGDNKKEIKVLFL